MVKSANSFLTQKVIEIEGVKYTSYEKMPIVGTIKWMVSLREVSLTTVVSHVPVKGPVYGYTYSLVQRSLKTIIPMHLWEKAKDINIENYRIELSR